MKYTIITTGSVLVMVLIMTLSTAQSMEMTTSHELAESGIIIKFSMKPDVSLTPQTVPRMTDEAQAVTTPPQGQVRFELAESGHMLIFSTNDNPPKPAPSPIRHVAKPYVETPAPLAGTPYHTRHTFEMAESGQTISFPDMTTAAPKIADPDIMACK